MRRSPHKDELGPKGKEIELTHIGINNIDNRLEVQQMIHPQQYNSEDTLENESTCSILWQSVFPDLRRG